MFMHILGNLRDFVSGAHQSLEKFVADPTDRPDSWGPLAKFEAGTKKMFVPQLSSNYQINFKSALKVIFLKHSFSIITVGPH